MTQDRSNRSFPSFPFQLPRRKTQLRTSAGDPTLRPFPRRLQPDRQSPRPARIVKILWHPANRSGSLLKSPVLKFALLAVARSGWNGRPHVRSSFQGISPLRLNSPFPRPCPVMRPPNSLCGTLWARLGRSAGVGSICSGVREPALQNGHGLHPNELRIDAHTYHESRLDHHRCLLPSRRTPRLCNDSRTYSGARSNEADYSRDSARADAG
jgi:hypothetical protein